MELHVCPLEYGEMRQAKGHGLVHTKKHMGTAFGQDDNDASDKDACGQDDKDAPHTPPLLPRLSPRGFRTMCKGACPANVPWYECSECQAEFCSNCVYRHRDAAAGYICKRCDAVVKARTASGQVETKEEVKDNADISGGDADSSTGGVKRRYEEILQKVHGEELHAMICNGQVDEAIDRLRDPGVSEADQIERLRFKDVGGMTALHRAAELCSYDLCLAILQWDDECANRLTYANLEIANSWSLC